MKYTAQLLARIAPHVFPSINQAKKAGYGYELREEELWLRKHQMGAVHIWIDQE